MSGSEEDEEDDEEEDELLFGGEVEGWLTITPTPTPLLFSELLAS